MSDLLLITDMARLNRFFERLADDNKLTLRVVNNLEKGGEEIAIKKPDVVFVQTHLSGLSADILLMHLKKQLGKKRTRFVLLATPGQVSSDVLKSYQGWLDISLKEKELTKATKNLLLSLLSKTQKSEPVSKAEDDKIPTETAAEELTAADAAVTPAFLTHDFAETATAAVSTATNEAEPTPLSPFAAAQEYSLEDQRITYSPRPRLSVYSEFNNSFDNAVNSIQEPETLKESVPLLEHKWNPTLTDKIKAAPRRSKGLTFMLWLIPVVVVVVIVTYIQMNTAVPKPVTVVAAPSASPVTPGKKAEPPAPANIQHAEKAKPSDSAKPALDSGAIDKAVISAITEIHESKPAPAPTPTQSKSAPAPPPSSSAVSGRIAVLPDFIPRYGYDKHYGKANPGWERYRGHVTEFKIFREGQTIKAIQVLDRGGRGVPESFMKGVLRQVAKKPRYSVESSEKKDGYEIARGSVSDNLSVVYYRDEHGGRLRAFVMTWQ